MLRRHIVLLIAIRSSDGDVKPGGPLVLFEKNRLWAGTGFHLLLPFIIIPHNTITLHKQLHLLTYSHPNLNFLPYTIQILIKISLTRVQHKVGSRDEMRWSSNILGPWVARVPADYAWRTITRADEMKRNGWDECGEMVEWNLWQGKTGETPWKTYPDPRSVHHETHMEGPRRELGTPAVGGESLTACATRHPHVMWSAQAVRDSKIGHT